MLFSLGFFFLRLLCLFFLLFFFGPQRFAVVLVNNEGEDFLLSQRRRGDGAWRTWFPRPPTRYHTRTNTPPPLHRPHPAHCPSQSRFERWKSVVSVVLEALLPKSRALPPPTIPISHHHPTSSNARERRRRRLAESSSFSFAGCGGASNFITGFSSSSMMISASTCLLRAGRFCSCCAASNRSKRGSCASLSLLGFYFFLFDFDRNITRMRLLLHPAFLLLLFSNPVWNLSLMHAEHTYHTGTISTHLSCRSLDILLFLI